MPTQSPNPARAQVPLRQVKHKQQRPMWRSPGRKFKFIYQKDIYVRLCGALLITPPSSSTVAEQYNTNVDVVPPSIVPGVIFTLSIPVPGNTPPTDPQASSASSGFQTNWLTPGPGFLPRSSVTAFFFAAPQVTHVFHRTMTTNDVTFHTPGGSCA